MMIYRELKRNIKSKEFKICFFAYLIFYLVLNYNMQKRIPIIDRNLYVQLVFLSQYPMGFMNSFYFIASLICGILGSDVLTNDIRESYYTSLIHREGKKNFIKNKAIAAFLTGGFFVISIFIIDIIIKAMIYPASAPNFHFTNVFDEKSLIADIWIYHTNLYLILSLFFTFCYCGLYSLIGFTFSLFVRKKMMVKTFTFVVLFILWNIASIFSLGVTMQSLLIYRITQVTNTPLEIVLYFLVPMIICMLIIHFRGGKYEYL